MTLQQLMTLSDKHDVRIDNHRNFQTSIPYYYDSLRHAFGFYCHTFITNNSAYNYYSQGLTDRNISVFKYQVLDQDNTEQTIIAFERFFELFLKDLLSQVDKKLTLILSDTNNHNKQVSVSRYQKGHFFSDALIAGHFVPKKIRNKAMSAPFRETIDRFYNLAHAFSQTPKQNRVIKKFGKVVSQYSFLFSNDYRVTFQYLNWYRDRILHNGNKLPSLWLLDYIVSQRIFPIIKQIVDVDLRKLEREFYYFKTVTGIEILNEFCEIKFDFKDIVSKRKIHTTMFNLLKIGHLKELGRANLNMNLFVRENKATYEYNYYDAKGRGERFALAEEKHAHSKDISSCPCCGVNSMVRYQIITNDILNMPEQSIIDWVKCYTCDYHLRFDTGEPSLLGLYTQLLFNKY